MIEARLLFITILVSIATGILSKLPEDFKPCKAGDKVCIKEIIDTILATKHKGYPELNIVSLDPFHIENLINRNQGSYDLAISNCQGYGFKNFKAIKVEGFGADPAGEHEVVLKGSKGSLICDYKAEGNFLNFDIKTSGESNITIDDPQYEFHIIGESKTKDGAVYLNVKDVKFNFNVTRVYFTFPDLIKGKPELTETLNKLLNENWGSVVMDIKQNFVDNFGITSVKVLQKVFNAIPYRDLLIGGN